MMGLVRLLGRRLGALAALWASLALPAAAAEMSSETERGLAIIEIRGEIVAGDLKRFRDLAIGAEQAIVWLDSPGGATREAIEIGRAIRLKGYDTFVGADEACNSACALVWLAGQTRWLEQGARVGFHATYLEADGKKIESGVGNAVVGAYLSQLNLGERAVMFATVAGPETLNWLTLDNAAALGVPVVELKPSPDDGRRAASGKNRSLQASSDGPETEGFRTVGVWSVAMDNRNGEGCYMGTSTDVGVHVVFIIDTQNLGAGYLVLAGDAWKSIKKNKKYKIVVQFDDEEAWDATAVGMELDGVKGVGVYVTEAKFLDEFSSAEALSVEYKGRSVTRLFLKDVEEALEALGACYRAEAARADPFAK